MAHKLANRTNNNINNNSIESPYITKMERKISRVGLGGIRAYN